MPSKIEIQVTCQSNIGEQLLRKSKKPDNVLLLEVAIPTKPVGVDQRLALPDNLNAHLERGKPRPRKPFLLKICTRSEKSKVPGEDLIQLHCSVNDQKQCHVTVNKCKASQLPFVHISSDEVSFTKNIRIGNVLSVEAKYAIRVQSSIVCPRISFYTPKGIVVIRTEGILRTTVVVSIAKKTYVEGQICYQEKIKRKLTSQEVEVRTGIQDTKQQDSISQEESNIPQSTREIPESCLKVSVDGDLHIGTDGKIGTERANNVHEHSIVTQLTLSVSGNIHNFGKIVAALILYIKAQSILTCRRCEDETVQRYFERTEERLGLLHNETGLICKPTSSNLLSAVNSCQIPLIPELLRAGVDPNEPTGKDRMNATTVARQKRDGSFVTPDYGGYSNNRDNPDAVASLLEAWERRSGTIAASSIKCDISRDIQDCGQLKGNTVHFMVGGDLIVEEDSVWTSGSVSGTCLGNVIVDGIVKLEGFKTFKICKEFLISEIGKVFTAKGGEIIVDERFCNMNRMLNAQELLDITTNVFEQDAHCLLGSKARLKLTIQGDSSHCEGEIKGERVLFNIAARVESKCEVYAEEICVIEIAQGLERKRFGRFINKGIINVINGELVAVRQVSTGVSDTADIIVEGKVICKGVRASSVHIRTMENSKIEIYPNPNTAAELPNINFLTGSFTTEVGSLLQLMTDTNNRDVMFRCCDRWTHCGELELIKWTGVEGLYDTSGYFEVFKAYHLGKIKNCDKFNLLVQEQFENHTDLLAKTDLSVTGTGNICNTSGSSIICREGSVKMNNIGSLTNEKDTCIQGQTFEATTSSAAMLSTKHPQLKKCDVQNQGSIVGVDDVRITAENISNTEGTIQSRRDRVRLIWTTERHKQVEISGKVLSPVEVLFTVTRAKYFVCKCAGGEVEEADSFALPGEGLLIDCTNSNVIFNTHIHGDADVKVLSKWNMFVLKDIHARSLCVMTTGKEVSDQSKNENEIVSPTLEEDSAGQNDGETDETTEAKRVLQLQSKEKGKNLTSILKNPGQEVSEAVTEEESYINELEGMLAQSDETFCTSVGNESSLSCHKITFTSESKRNIRLQTKQNSRILCEKSFCADRDVIFDCSLQMSHGSSLTALGLEFTSDAEFSIAKTVDDVESKVVVYFVNSFENHGNIYNKDNVLCHLYICRVEDEPNTENKDVSPPLETELKSSYILMAGTANISGYLGMSNVDQVNIDQEANVSCQGFYMPQSENKNETSLLIESGCLSVQGPCTCFLEKLNIRKRGVFKQFSGDDEHECRIEVRHSAELSGRLESNLKGRCLIRCEENLICKSLYAEIESKSFKMVALQSAVVDNDCDLFVKNGQLCITNAEEESVEVNGEIEICGKLGGNVLPECDEGSARKSSLEIEGCKVFFKGARLTGFNKTELFAAEYMMIDPASELKDGEDMEIELAALELQGEIKTYETLNLKPRTMLVTGKIHKCSKITIEAEYTVVNCGEIHGKHTGIVSPIYLNCPEFPDGKLNTAIETVPQLGSDEQKELIIEGLLCIIVGSHLQGTNINIKSVLRFEFATKASTVPNSSDLDNWKNVVNCSLSKMNSSVSKSDVEKLVEQAASIPKVICKLGVASHLCSDIVQMSQNIRNGGLNDFNVETLVGSLNKAHSEYTKISSFNLQLNIRPKLRKVRDAKARTARNLMNKCFGSSSFGNRHKFKDDSEIEEGIEATSFIFQGESTDVRTEGSYIADSLTFNGGKGSWKNQGHLEACGDIFISAKTVYQKGSRVAQAIAGGRLLLQAQDLEIENIKAKKLQAKATGSAKIKSAEINDDLHVRGEESVSIKSLKVANDVFVSGGDIAATDLESKHLQTDAAKSTTIESARVTQDATIHGKGKIKVAVVKAQNLSVDGRTDVSIGDIKAKDNVQAKSAKGGISLDSKIEGNLLRFEADKVSLTGKAGKANHELKTLSIKCKQIQNIESLLNKSGVYEDMQISDQLDLAVEDQSVVLANVRKLDFDLALRAASIDVVSNIRTDHSIQLQATKQNLNLHQRSSVTSSKKVYMESEKGSVNVIGAHVRGGDNVTMIAKHDVNILAVGGNQSAQKSTVSAGTGNALEVKAGRDIKIHASDVTSEGANQFIAGRDTKITAHTYQTVHRKTKSSCWGLKKETTTTTTTHVDKSNIRGKTNVLKAGGEFTSIATNIQSEDGNIIHAKGNVSFKDIVSTQTVKKSTKVLRGLLYNRNEKEDSKISHGTLVEDTSSLANTKVISDTSNIEWTGSSMKSPGNFAEIAHEGKVKHTRKILTKTYQATECGFYFSNPSSGKGVGFGFKFQHTDGSMQTTSDDSVEVGGNNSIEAKEFEALNSFSFHVDGDMTLDARKVTFAGAELKSSENSGGFDVGVSDTAFRIGVDFSDQHGTQQQSQSLYTGGTLRMANVEDATFDNSVADVGAMEGDIKNLNVISRADSACNIQAGFGIGFDLATKSPTLDLSIGVGISRFVKEQASINVRSGSDGLSVKTLTLTGAAMTFDGDVHDFAEHIVSHDVHEIENEFGLGLNISIKAATAKSVKKLSLAMQHSQGRLRSCVTSTKGDVHQSIKNKVNTDMDKCRVVDAKFGFAVAHEFKGGLAKNAAAIGKSIAKSAGKDVLKACGERLVSELGLPDDIANAIIDIAEGNAPLRETIIFVAGKACVPMDLVEAIEDLIMRKDPNKLLIWICTKAGIDHGIVAIIMDIIKKGKFEPESFLQFAKHMGTLLGLSDDVLMILTQLVRDKQSGVCATSTIHSTTMRLMKSPEGQQVTKQLCKLTGIPDDIANLIIDFFKHTKLAEKGVVILQAVGIQLNLPGQLSDGIKQALLHQEFKSLLVWICTEAGIDQNVVLVIVDNISKNKDLKETMHVAIRCMAKYCGISDRVISDVECRVAGKQPKDGIFSLIFHIIDDLSKSKHFLETRKLLCGQLELICKELRIPSNILKNISDLKHQIAAGKTPTAAIPFVLYLLESFGVSNDLVDAVKTLLKNRDPCTLASWLASKLGLDPKFLSLLTKDMVNGKSFKYIVISAIKYYCVKYNMPAKLTDDIAKIIDEDLSKCCRILKKTVQQNSLRRYPNKRNVKPKERKQAAESKNPKTKHGITNQLQRHEHQYCDPIQEGSVESCERKCLQNVEQSVNTTDLCTENEHFSSDDTNDCQEGQGPSEAVPTGSVNTNDAKRNECTATQICVDNLKQVEAVIPCDFGQMVKNVAENSKVLQLLEEYDAIMKESKEGRILFEALCALDGTEDSLVKILCPLAEKIGIPEAVVMGMSDFVIREDPTNLALWLGGVTSVEPDVIAALLKSFCQKKLQETMPILMKCLCRKIGLPKITVEMIDKLFSKGLKDDEMRAHLIKIAFETVTPKVRKLAADAGIPDVLVELLLSVVDVEKPTDLSKIVSKLLERLVSMFCIPCDVINQISVLCTQIAQKQYRQAALHLLLFLLERSRFPRDVIDIVEGLLNKDVSALVRWLSRKFDIDEHILVKLVRDIRNGAPVVNIIKCCVEIFCTKLKLPLVVTTDIELILEGKAPENAMKIYEEFIRENSGDITAEAVFRKCEELQLPRIFVDCVETVFKQHSCLDKAINLFTILAGKCGVPEDFSFAIADIIFRKDTTKMLVWIEKETGIKPVLSEAVVQIVISVEVDVSSAKRLLRGVCLSVGLSNKTSDKVQAIFDVDMPRKDTKLLVIDIATELSIPHISKAIEHCAGIPKDIVTNLLCIFRLDTSFEQCWKLIEILALKFGMPEDLVKAISELVCSQNVSPIAVWISHKIGVDEQLVLSGLGTLRSAKNLSEAAKKLPVCFFKYLGLSNEVLSKIEMLFDGKLSTREIPKLLTLVTVELFKSNVDKNIVEMVTNVITTEDWFERVMHFVRYIAKTHNIPVKSVDGVADLIKKKDPTKIAIWLADKMGVDQTVMVTLARAVLQSRDPKQILRSIAKAAGIPEEAVFVLEEIIKRNTGEPSQKSAVSGSRAGTRRIKP